MLIDQAEIRELLGRIADRLATDAALREDLFQEALIHLWLLEERRPGQTQSWYLQSCHHHLQNYKALGRSIDSPKRRRGKFSLASTDDDLNQLIAKSETDSAVVGQVSARDMIAILSRRLSQRERTILEYLAEGRGAREIATKLKVTHPCVIKYRRKIAALALKLGIGRPPQNHANGKSSNGNGKSRRAVAV